MPPLMPNPAAFPSRAPGAAPADPPTQAAEGPDRVSDPIPFRRPVMPGGRPPGIRVTPASTRSCTSPTRPAPARTR